MTTSTILVADNDVDYLETIRDVLENAGYQVKPASDPDQARQMLAGGDVNLAILDLRLVDDADEKDLTGLWIAKQVAPSVPKIILTSFPTYEAVRHALGPQLDGLSLAVNYISKDEGVPALLAAIRGALKLPD